MRGLYRILRFMATQFGFLQRLPFFLLILPIFLVLLPFSRNRLIHKLFVFYCKGCIRFYFWLNGIKLDVPIHQIREMEEGFFLINFSRFTDLLLVLNVFSYKKLVLLDPSIFVSGITTYIFSLLGFCPKQHSISVETLFSDSFYYEPYVNQQFSVIEFEYMSHQGDSVIPNVMALSLRYKKPLHCFKLTGTTKLMMASFFTPQVIRLEFVETVPVNRRPELSLLNYDHVKYKYELDAVK